MSKIIKVTKALCLSIALTATSLSANVPASSVETDVLKAEQVRVNAVVNNDYVALQSLLSDDLTYTHSTASRQTKTEFLASLRSGQFKYKAIEHEEQRVRVYSDTAVLTTFTRVTAISDGRESQATLRATIVYIKSAGQWQMVAWQSTRVP
jgi:ketosteroid isomerase-like protein